jgi:hypothetical protein
VKRYKIILFTVRAMSLQIINSTHRSLAHLRQVLKQFRWTGVVFQTTRYVACFHVNFETLLFACKTNSQLLEEFCKAVTVNQVTQFWHVIYIGLYQTWNSYQNVCWEKLLVAPNSVRLSLKDTLLGDFNWCRSSRGVVGSWPSCSLCRLRHCEAGGRGYCFHE